MNDDHAHAVRKAKELLRRYGFKGLSLQVNLLLSLPPSLTPRQQKRLLKAKALLAAELISSE